MKINFNFPRIKGEKVYLAPLRSDEEAINLYTKWINDEEILMYIQHNYKTCSFEEEIEWAKKAALDKKVHTFSIIEKSSENLIGTCSIKPSANNIDFSLGIMIGDKDSREKGYGTEVISLLIKYCFEELRAHRVSLSLNAENERAHKCYLKNGFKDCGIFHENIFFNGHYADSIYMEILENDYFKN